MREIGSESNSISTPKRCRDPEDEVYLDNFHSHKRYLSEIMASSLNGLSVDDASLSESVMESPARSETISYLRDEMSLQYSPMSEDSDDARCSETHLNTSMVQSESVPTSPVSSPHRHQRLVSSFSSTTTTTTSSYPLHSYNSVGSSQPRQRSSDSEGRFPSSPSDICHSSDLRKATLLKSVHLRSHQPVVQPTYDQSFTHGLEEVMRNVEASEGVRSDFNFSVAECSSEMNVKEEPPPGGGGGGGGEGGIEDNELKRSSLARERRSLLSEKAPVDSSI